MKIIKNFSSILMIAPLLTGMLLTISCTTDPGTLEAINSASSDCRNIIGIEIANITNEQRALTKYGGDGVYVSAVILQHPASMAGVKAGDIIVSINSMPVTDVSEALAVMNGLEPGGKYPFQIYRTVARPGLKSFTAHILIEKVQERAIGKIS